MSGTLAVFGAAWGVLICGTAGAIGSKAVLAAAVNEEQRQVLRQVFRWGGIAAAVVTGIIVLAAVRVLPQWAYAVALVLWFGPLLTVLSCVQQRLEAAAGQGEGSCVGSLSAA